MSVGAHIEGFSCVIAQVVKKLQRADKKAIPEHELPLTCLSFAMGDDLVRPVKAALASGDCVGVIPLLEVPLNHCLFGKRPPLDACV